MVLPSEEGFRVRIVRDREGRFIGYQDPDLPQGPRFISRVDAIERLRYNLEQNAIVDSFGNPVGVGGLALPLRGTVAVFKNVQAEYVPIGQDPAHFTPNPNQEIVERTVVIDKDGKLTTFDTSYGLGSKYDPAKYGGRWRKGVADALGLREGERLPSSDLKRAVAYQEYLIKTVEGVGP